jgi:hypothetical protein
MLLEIEKTLVEGAGAAGLAALLKDPARFAGRKVGLVLCGGNIDPLLLASILERGMVRAGRLARIRVAARDNPGVLARITGIVAEAGANIDEVHHQRAFSSLSVQSVEVELVLQTRNREHRAGRCRTPGRGWLRVLHSRPCVLRVVLLWLLLVLAPLGGWRGKRVSQANAPHPDQTAGNPGGFFLSDASTPRSEARHESPTRCTRTPTCAYALSEKTSQTDDQRIRT